MKFLENSFDAVFVIETIVHVFSFQDVYEQIYRVLKLDDSFELYEWIMIDKFDVDNSAHCVIRLDIERENEIVSMKIRTHAKKVIKAVEFLLEHSENLATRQNDIQWYYSITEQLKRQSLKRIMNNLIQTKVDRFSVSMLLSVLKLIRLVLARTIKISRELALAADNLIADDRKEIFTLMYFMIVKKPQSWERKKWDEIRECRLCSIMKNMKDIDLKTCAVITRCRRVLEAVSSRINVQNEDLMMGIEKLSHNVMTQKIAVVSHWNRSRSRTYYEISSINLMI